MFSPSDFNLQPAPVFDALPVCHLNRSPFDMYGKPPLVSLPTHSCAALRFAVGFA